MAKDNQPHWSPLNPHPLSQMRTELVWEGKYDEFGNRREVDVAALQMPMQRIETVDEPRSQAAAKGQLDLFDQQMETKRRDDFRNRLIWGDNKLVMASLLKEFKGKIDLIYIDPPFDVGADFTMDVPIGDGKGTVAKDQSTLEMVAYRDMWGRGSNSYLQMISERLILLRDLLSDKGCIYIHCDWHVGHFLRAVAEDVFGKDCFLNEVIWKRQSPSSSKARAKRFSSDHDTLFIFTKTKNFKFNAVYGEYPKHEIEKRFRQKDSRGRYKDAELATYSDETLQRLKREDRLIITKGGKYRYKIYLDEIEGVLVDSLWMDIPPVNSQALESTAYATQKPEALLNRILAASSEEGDLVADFFCGSGVLGAVAEKLNRRWIMADLGRFAIHTSRKRMIEVQRQLHADDQPYRSFDVYNLGRYERQWWQKERLEGADEEHRRVVLEFFRAEILENAPSPLIHGKKSGAFCHVDSIDSIFTRDEAKEVAEAVNAAGGREVYCLAWEFEMDLRLATAALEKEFGVKFKLIPIPREIMEKNRTSPPPFLEMALLDAEAVVRKDKDGPKVEVKLTQFMPSLSEVPSKELEALKERAIKSGFDFIDFWAVDFDWQPGKPFSHHWQDYRTRKDRSLKTVSDAGFTYPSKGKYTICVKVFDVFGCDTSTTIELEV